MTAYTGQEVCSLLEQEGWRLARVKGSHHIYVKEGERALIVVPVHRSRTLKTGLLRAIFKLAGLEEERPHRR